MALTRALACHAAALQERSRRPTSRRRRTRPCATATLGSRLTGESRRGGVTPSCLTRHVSGAVRCRYTTCIALYPSGERDEKLLCNRSLAYLKAGRHALAADDAQRACTLAPGWNKAWYRLGAALAALQQHAAALEAFTRSLRLDPKREVLAAVRSTVKRLTREQLAAQLLRWLDEAQACGAMSPPETEDVSPSEREEAMFRYLQLSMRDKPRPGDYYDYIALWCETPWSTGALHPASVALQADCGSQAWRTSTAQPCFAAPSATDRQLSMHKLPSHISSPAAPWQALTSQVVGTQMP